MRRMTTLAVPCLLAALTLALSAVAQQRPMNEPDIQIDAAARGQVIDSVLKRLNESYVFPEVAKNMESSIRERMGRKEYEQITSAAELARTLTEHLQAVSRDKHLRVRHSAEKLPADEGRRSGPSAEERERFRQFANRVNHGFERVERLPGNVGYIDLRGFMDAEAGAETVAAALNFLANTDALIFDLRQNGGGQPGMVRLISSYLFGAEPVHLNSLYWREGDRTEEFWTLKDVPGKRYMNKDVYVLTSNRTFSAAEEFTYNLKSLKRATVVGEATGGGAHPGGGFRVGEHFQMFVPTGRAINPITKTNWEGTGVEPDVKVTAQQALKTAHLMALKKSVEKLSDPRQKRGVQMEIESLEKELGEMKAKQQ
ncbi:MAG: S41 family peptidase [Pyrinomonadaceae bacterium]